MLKVKDIVQSVERLAPPQLAAAWDNPGLLLGNREAECRRVMVALDLSQAVLAQAAAQDCQLILTHHPFIFSGQKQVLAGSYEGDLIMALARAGIAALAAHTNWDNALGGINRALAEALDLQNIAPLAEPPAAEILLLAGDLPQPLPAQDLLALVAHRLRLPVVRAAGLQVDKLYRRLAVVGGAGMDFWPQAQAAGCDALLSADGKHHIGLQAAHNGFAVIDGTHFATEVIGIERLGQKLAAALPELTVLQAEVDDAWAFYAQNGVCL